MKSEIHDQFGADGNFVWWCGLVENNLGDPLQLGRVQVRIFNIHSQDHSQVPPSTLPWASVGQDPSNSSTNGIGQSPTGISNGALCFGFFLDGNHYQQPKILSSFPGTPNGKSDISPLAIGTQILKKGGGAQEPADNYSVTYPNNKVLTTSSGHAIQVNDTPGHEFIEVFHKSGTYVNIGPDGDLITKVAGKNYSINGSDSILTIAGTTTVHFADDVNVTCDGTMTINNDINVVGDVNVDGDVNANNI